ncbi:CMGC/DYRK protein kinase [Pseudogymnoascus sp. 03VT05]|nr:CMGC/DYRK protein kinase [Pseudogymnoascus sp. 03VT05]
MSKLPVTVGQILKGRNGLYEVIETLKTNTVFKAAILTSTSEEIPLGAQQLAVIKTETDASMKYVFNRERNNYELPHMASCKTIRALRDVISFDPQKPLEPQCMVFEWMDQDLRTVAYSRFCSKPELPRVIARSVLETLAFLKETYGAFHSDINPNNILLSNVDSSCPVVKVGDLGNMLREGYDDTRIQSLPTRAPEVWCGLGCFHSSDVWSLGATLMFWLAQRLVFGAGDKIIDNNTEAWCIAKIIRLVGPISPPVNEAFLDEFSLARALEKEGYEDPETGEMKQFITVGTIRQEIERIEGVPQDLIEFIEYLLVIDHTKRPTAREALGHPYLADVAA